jgi:hypothetical protein
MNACAHRDRAFVAWALFLHRAGLETWHETFFIDWARERGARAERLTGHTGCGWHIRPKGETPMFRKITIALTAAAAITTVALAPTSASAHWSGGHGFGFGHGFRGGFGITVINPAVSCVTYQWVQTRRGAWVKVPVNNCDY